MNEVVVNWIKCTTYEEAKDLYSCVYCHEWDCKPYYWGKIDKSVFGGSRRLLAGRTRNARYGPSYRHWIEGCLQHGATLYAGIVKPVDSKFIEAVETDLIRKHPTNSNRRTSESVTIRIRHVGDMPHCLRGESTNAV